MKAEHRGRLYGEILTKKNKQIISFELDGDFRNTFDELNGKEIDIAVKEHREKRSLNANSYFHVLVNKIAKAVNSSDDEIKSELVVRYGTIAKDEDGNIDGAIHPYNTDPSKYYPYYRYYKDTEINGKLYKCYIYYKRTRHMDSSEFSHLLDGTISEAQELGIQTETPDKIAEMMSRWGE